MLEIAGRPLAPSGEPLLMGIVNATTDSFSDAGLHPTLEARVSLARRLVAEGAAIIDVGGESGVTNRPAVDPGDEITAVVPLIERIVAETGAVVSVDTYKPEVARAALAAGATIVNDVSGLRDPRLAEVCAEYRAGLVVMHTAAPPKQRIQDPLLYGDIVEDVLGFLRERIALAVSLGMAEEQLIVDPGPDFAKTPAQTVELLRGAARLQELGRPVLMAISRKDFIGAIAARRPRERLAGTLAALAHGLDCGARIFRVHEVAAAADFIAVREALRGEREVPADLRLGDELRWEEQGPARGAVAADR